MAIESTPVSGVDIRNAVVGPGPAPCFLSEAATGTTPHEHSGRGTPRSAAFTTALAVLPPRCRVTNESGIIALSMPAISRPNST